MNELGGDHQAQRLKSLHHLLVAMMGREPIVPGSRMCPQRGLAGGTVFKFLKMEGLRPADGSHYDCPTRWNLAGISSLAR